MSGVAWVWFAISGGAALYLVKFRVDVVSYCSCVEVCVIVVVMDVGGGLGLYRVCHLVFVLLEGGCIRCLCEFLGVF